MMGMARRTKRLWSDDEKRSICFQTAAPGFPVAQVARRYAVNANLIFKWLRDSLYARPGFGSGPGGGALRTARRPPDADQREP